VSLRGLRTVDDLGGGGVGGGGGGAVLIHVTFGSLLFFLKLVTKDTSLLEHLPSSCNSEPNKQAGVQNRIGRLFW